MEEKNKEISSKELEDLFAKHLKEHYNIGLRTGIKVASQVVLNMLEDKNKKFSEKLSAVKHFCKVSVSNDNFISGKNSENESVENIETFEGKED